MTTIRPPDPFIPGDNPAQAWDEYKERYQFFTEASKLKTETAEYQKNVFLHVLGPEGLRIYKTLTIVADASKTPLERIHEAFDKYYRPYKSINYSRYRLFTTKQSRSQTFHQYFTTLKTIAPACALGELQNSILATIILIGTKSPEARKKMLLKDDLTLEEATSICQIEEASTEQLQQMTNTPTHSAHDNVQTLDAINYIDTQRSRAQQQSYQPRHANRPRATSEIRRHPRQNYEPRSRAMSQGQRNRPPINQTCDRCGLTHQHNHCPARGSRCRSCGRMNHWASTCRSIRALEEIHRTEDFHHAHQYEPPSYDASDTTYEPLYLNSLSLDITTTEDSPKPTEDNVWKAKITIAGRAINFKIDTGSQVNVISSNEYKHLLDPPPLRKPRHTIRAYSGHLVPVMGTVYLPCSSQVASTYSLFYVTPTSATPILSGQLSQSLGLIARLTLNIGNQQRTQAQMLPNGIIGKSPTKTIPTLPLPLHSLAVPNDKGNRTNSSSQEIIETYKDIFDKIGKLPGEYELRVKPHTQPTICPPRRIPIQLRDDVYEELQRMKENGIIEEAKEPSEWVHPMVVVKKDQHQSQEGERDARTTDQTQSQDVRLKTKNRVRICIDPRNLNPALLRSQFQMPTSQEIFADLAGSKFFTVLDAQSAFWQIQLTKTSSRLCTFSTPYGRFRFKRLPYGISTASQLFQQVMQETFGDIPNVRISTDDFVIHGIDQETHNKTLIAVLKRARQVGLTFSTKKMQLAVPQIKYLGHIISGKGVEPDPAKIKAITDLPPPSDKAALRRFLGMVNYLARFIPSYSERTSQLRSLLKADVEYHWDANLQRTYDDVKTAISSTPVLRLYDPKIPCTVSVDASQHGVGAVLLQDHQPIEYASMTFDQTQVRYAQIEKELLAVLFACERFHFFIAAAPVTVQTDHRPLLAVIKKPFSLMSPRLQRLTLRLARYDPTLVYVPGSQLYVADTLSRATLPESKYDTSFLEGPNATVYSLTTMSHDRETKFRTETDKDKTLQTVIQHISQGWPTHRNKIRNHAVQQFWPVQEELHTEDGLVFRGDRLVVPETLRHNTLMQIHSVHQGITSCQAKARIHVYWPNMSQDIKEFIQHCDTCRSHDRANTATPIQPLPIPPTPWHTVGTDLFQHQGRHYILLVDYYSKYVEIQELQTMTANAVIAFIEPQIARHGAPQKLISDNGPPYNSATFKDFLNKWNIEHRTASPHHPQANGQSERTVQTMKNLMEKALKSGKNLNQILLEYRTTPKGALPSPAEVLMGRRLRTPLTTNPTTLQPHYPTNDIIKALAERQKNMLQQADTRPNKPLLRLKTGDSVRYMAGPRLWIPATVQRPDKHGNSYIIRSENGRLYRRTRTHLRPDVSSRIRHDHRKIETRREEPRKQKDARMDDEEPKIAIQIPLPGPVNNTPPQQQRMSENQTAPGALGVVKSPTTQETRTIKAATTKPGHSLQGYSHQITRSGRISKKPEFFSL